MLPVPVCLCQSVYRDRVQIGGKKDIKNVSGAEQLCDFCDALMCAVPYLPSPGDGHSDGTGIRKAPAARCPSGSVGTPHPLEFDFPILFPAFFGRLDCQVELERIQIADPQGGAAIPTGHPLALS